MADCIFQKQLQKYLPSHIPFLKYDLKHSTHIMVLSISPSLKPAFFFVAGFNNRIWRKWCYGISEAKSLNAMILLGFLWILSRNLAILQCWSSTRLHREMAYNAPANFPVAVLAGNQHQLRDMCEGVSKWLQPWPLNHPQPSSIPCWGPKHSQSRNKFLIVTSPHSSPTQNQ